MPVADSLSAQRRLTKPCKATTLEQKLIKKRLALFKSQILRNEVKWVTPAVLS